jgi:hypothetical protein
MSTQILLGSVEKTVMGQVTEILTEIQPTNRKLEILYRITVNQNAISKRAYDYFENIKKNATETGGLFAPTPSELRGNITCVTDPAKPVIGYVDISTTTQKRIYINPTGVYEYPRRGWAFPCDEPYTWGELLEMYDPNLPPDTWKPYIDKNLEGSLMYVLSYCLDCTHFGITQKPYDWPK